METKTIVAAFAGQKGGTGKTMAATSTASYLHYRLGKKVLVIDSDSPQYSLWTYRNHELGQLQDNKRLANSFEKQNVPIYPIINSTIAEIPNLLDEHRNSGLFDVIVLDTPGTVNVQGYKECLMAVDYVITPLEAEDMSLTSNLEFITYLIDEILEAPNSRLKDYYVFWNKIRRNANKDFFIEVHTSLLENGINILDSLVEDRVDYQRMICRSTLFPISLSHKDSGLGNLINVVSEKILKN